jgi:hypothetical protein
VIVGNIRVGVGGIDALLWGEEGRWVGRVDFRRVGRVTRRGWAMWASLGGSREKGIPHCIYITG